MTDIYPDCIGTGKCGADVCSPNCLSRWRTDAEIDAWVYPSDDELRGRRDLTDATDVPAWARPHPYLTPAQRLLAVSGGSGASGETQP